MATINVDVDIEIDEYLDEADTDALEKELARRSRSYDRERLVRDAYRALQSGDPATARDMLHSYLFPKWRSMEACEREYKSTKKQEQSIQ